MSEETLWKKAGRISVQGLTYLCSVILFVMMLLTISDVALRYLFNAPLRGAYELTELSLAMLIYAGLPLVSLRNLHVTTDFLDQYLGPRGQKIAAVLINSVCGLGLIGVGWVVWTKAMALGAAGDTTLVRGIVLAPFVYAISIMVFITAVIHLEKAFRGDAELGGESVI